MAGLFVASLLEGWAYFWSALTLPIGWLGRFHFFGLNPRKLTRKDLSRHPIVLVHASGHNQAGWLLLAWRLWRSGIGPLYTFNYTRDHRRKCLRKRLESIRDQYRSHGVERVEFILVGHSFGGVTALEYANYPRLYVEGTSVHQVITVASRLRHLDGEPSSCYHHIAQRLEAQFRRAWKGKGPPFTLINVSAERDYMVPTTAQLLEDGVSCHYQVENISHVSIVYSSQLHSQLIRWLN